MNKVIAFFRVRKIFSIPLLTIVALMYILPIVNDNFKVRHVFGILPTLFVSVKSPFWFKPIGTEYVAAINFGLVSVVKHEFATDKKTIEHELVHVEQTYRTFFLSPILYHLNDKYMVQEEAEAYVRTEIEDKALLINFAHGIKYQYAKDSDVSVEYIHEQLKKCWKKYKE